MIKKIVMLFVLGMFIQFNIANAQGCEGDDLGTENDSLAPKNIVFGFMQPQYTYAFTDGDENTFNFKRARFGIRGKIIDDFSYYFMIEASAFVGGSGDAYLMDAFVTWSKYNWYRLSIGSFKQPFSLDVTTACHSLTTIDRSIVADQLVAPQRDFGLMLLGGNNYTKFNYAVALMNGKGIGGIVPNDDNTKKDIIGRATYKATDFLTVGGSFRYGYPIPNNNEDDRTTFGAEVKLDLNNWHFQGEYIYDEGAYFLGSGGGCGATPIPLGEERDGAYAMISYDTKWNLQPVFKYEFFDSDTTVKDNLGYQEMMTIGFNYFFSDKLRLQVNYQARIETVNSVDNDMLLSQIQVRF